MLDQATPAEESKTPAATPAPTEGSKTVTLTEEEHQRLQRDAARAAEAQSRADRLERIAKRSSGKKTDGQDDQEDSEDDGGRNAAKEDRKAERGLMRLAADPAYRELLDGDQTLKDLLLNNPLAALSIYAPEAMDAEDGIGLIREVLDKRLASKKPATPSTAQTPATAPKVAPNPAAQPADEQVLNEEFEAAKKDPNTERAVASMIRVSAKRQLGQFKR